MKWSLKIWPFGMSTQKNYREIADNWPSAPPWIGSVRFRIFSINCALILLENGISAEISGRPKQHLFDLRKMAEKGKPFEMVRDLRAVRCIVKDIPTVIWRLVSSIRIGGRFRKNLDDYIAAPKDNFYQSIHTAVIFDDGKPLEVQSRARWNMHQNAEFGIRRPLAL
jgi:GTP pyrophosphokinase